MKPIMKSTRSNFDLKPVAGSHAAIDRTDEFAIDRWTNEGGALFCLNRTRSDIAPEGVLTRWQGFDIVTVLERRANMVAINRADVERLRGIPQQQR